MEFKEIFLWTWFAISSFIMLHLYLTRKELKNKITELFDEGGLEDRVNKWDNDYAGIIATYGDFQYFMEAHNQDFEYIRAYLTNFILQQQNILNDFIEQYCTTPQIKKGNVLKLINSLADTQNTLSAFVVSEARAHEGEDSIIDILSSVRTQASTVELQVFLNDLKEDFPEEYENALRIFCLKDDEHDSKKH